MGRSSVIVSLLFVVASASNAEVDCHTGNCDANEDEVSMLHRSISTHDQTPDQVKQIQEQARKLQDMALNFSGQQRCGAMICSKESTCCDEAPTGICGSPESTCCYNPEKTIANLCAPGSSCNTNSGNCYASSLGQFQCGVIACAKESVCCEEAPTALCGSKGSTCCYNKEKTIANLCAPGSSCNFNTGNCFASSLGQFACGAIACAKDSVCCDEAPTALCGSPGSTCCYDPLKKIANLCSPGTFCSPSGRCAA